MIPYKGSTPTELAAVEMATFSYFRYFARLPGAELSDAPEITWFATGIPLDLFNGVIRANLDYHGLDTTIETILRRFQDRMVPMLWHTAPSTRPVDLGSHLANHGLLLVEEETGMAADLSLAQPDAPLPQGLSIQTVSIAQDLDDWARVWAGRVPPADLEYCKSVFGHLGLGLSLPLRLYLGRLNGQAVATAALFLYNYGGDRIASIQHVVTEEQYRRRGFGTAMVRWLMQESRACGAPLAVLTASVMGINLYRRLGFHVCGEFQAYAWDEKYGPT
jgi:ribosomal protein S18 acetylase RimI-like enzyme